MPKATDAQRKKTLAMLVGGDSDEDDDEFKPQKRATKEELPIPVPKAMKDDSEDEDDFKPK